MTTPLPQVPAPSPDPLLDTLPGAIVAQQESPCIMRIGVVAAIIEGSQITVKISGSEVLVDCSYLFGQYYPLIGDRVIVMKQDSQWFCHGQMSGTIASNNQLPNSSFEDGTVGSMPTGWTIVVGAVAAGIPDFLVASPGSTNISGINAADYGTDSVGAGVSTADVYSPSIVTVAGTHWTAAYFLTSASLGSSAPLFSYIDMWIQFLNGAGAVITQFLVNSLPTSADIIGPLYRRFNLSAFPLGYVEAPGGTTMVRLRFESFFDLPASSFASFYIDNVILRQVD